MTTDGTSDGVVVADAVQFVPSDETGRQKSAKPSESQREDSSAEIVAALDSRTKDAKTETIQHELSGLNAELDRLKKSVPPAPPLVMSIRDEKQPADCRVCIRGELKNTGDAVPRGFVTVATAGAMPRLPADSSGRLRAGPLDRQPR